MRAVSKGLLGLIFSFLFLIFISLSAINFQFLNQSYLFFIFDSQHVYSQLPNLLASSLPNAPNLPREEKEGYTEIIKKLSPEIFEKIIKENLTNSLDFIWGKTNKIVVFVPAQKLGIGKTDFQWNPTPQIYQQIKIANGIGQKIFLSWALVLALLLGCYLLYSRLTETKKLLSGNSLLIINGSTLVIIGLLLEAAMFFVAKTLPAQMEPSQAVLKFLFSSILPPMVLLWILAGGLLIFGGMIFKRISRKL